MLYVFGFERLAVVVSDLYFKDPHPMPGQEGAERGVRLELREVRRDELRGGVYSAQPISVDVPVWRVDLLESVASAPGSFDRTHHHPRFKGWEPSKRTFVPALSADPLGWLGDRLTHLDEVLDEADVAPGRFDADELAQVAAEAPRILSVVQSLLDRIGAGELGQPPADAELDTPGLRFSWL